MQPQHLINKEASNNKKRERSRPKLHDIGCFGI